MNKWKIGFFVLALLFLIVSIMLIKTETKNAFYTIRNSLTTSYITTDLKILNELITTKCKITKVELLSILPEGKSVILSDSIDNLVYYNGCKLIFNNTDELIKIEPLP